MSNQVNVELLERASEMIDYWVGTQYAEQIEMLLGMNDLEQLQVVVNEAYQAMFQEEYFPNNDDPRVGDMDVSHA